MASSSAHFSLFLLLITLSSSSLKAHARDSQFFNKVSSAAVNNNNDVIPDGGRQPNFLRDENDNAYGVYSHATTTAAAAEKPKPIHDYFPKNYNPVAYVTEAEGMTNESPADTEGNVFTRNSNMNYNYNSGRGGFNSRPQRFNGGGVRPQGMSDTRFMDNGRYYYDVNAERFGKNHPYVANAMRDDGTRIENYSNNLYGNNGNAVEFNGEGFDEDEVEDEVKNLP